MRLSDPVTAIRGVGEKTAELMRKLGIETVEELLHAYPRNYDRYEPPVRIEEIKRPGIYAVWASVAKRPEVKPTKRLKVVTALLKDESGRRP